MQHRLFFLMALAMMLIVYAPPASAELQLFISSGGMDVTISDNELGKDLNPLSGAITYIGDVNNWGLTVTTGLGSEILINGMDLSSIDTVTGSGTGADALVLKLSENNWVKPAGASVIGHIGGTLHGTLTYQVYANPTNTLLDTNAPATLVAGVTFGPLTGGGFATPLLGFGGNVAGGTFALTQVIKIETPGPGVHATSFDASLTVPEPTAVTLLGCFFVGALGVLRRKTRNS